VFRLFSSSSQRHSSVSSQQGRQEGHTGFASVWGIATRRNAADCALGLPGQGRGSCVCVCVGGKEGGRACCVV
jgi:hypothetical protein